MSWFDPWDEIEAVAAERRSRRARDRARRARRSAAHPRRAPSSGRELSTADVRRRCSASTGDDLRRAGRARPTTIRARRRRRRRHLRRQPQHQLHQRLLRELPVLRLQAPALGGRRLHPRHRRRARQGRRGHRARRHRGLHAGRHQPRHGRRSPTGTSWSPSRQRYPALHMHAFSPMEIMYGARRTEHGLRRLPRHAARRRPRRRSRAPRPRSSTTRCARSCRTRRSTSRTWIEIITTAHRARHADARRRSCTATSRPPAHVARAPRAAARPAEARPAASPSSSRSASSGRTRSSTTTAASRRSRRALRDLRMYAVCRLMLRGVIDNLQTSWVKLGHRLAQLSLRAGCNDFGGTLMEESISREAGADAGEYTSVEEIEAPGPRASGACPRSGRRSTDGSGSDGARARRSRCWRVAWEAARFLRGLSRRTDPRQLTIIGNTGDDEEFFGLHVSPDLDTVLYTLAGRADPVAAGALARRHLRVPRRRSARSASPTWFQLGDRDLATHVCAPRGCATGRPLTQRHRSARRVASASGARCCR